jgi:predicted secreted Zn-dependent protease
MKKSFSYAPKPFLKMPRGFRKLPVECAVYVPNRDKNGIKISEKKFKERIKKVEKKFLELFGGHTTDELEHGEYLSTKKKIINEKVCKISCFSDIKDYKKQRKELEKWLTDMKKEWNQDCIGYEFESDLYYI